VISVWTEGRLLPGTSRFGGMWFDSTALR